MVPFKMGRKVALPFKDEDVIPIACRSQRFSPAAAADIVNKQVDPRLESGAVRPSTSSRCSPVSLVPKLGESFHICIDYRVLDAQIKMDSGHLADIAGKHDRMHGSKFFTSFDMAQAPAGTPRGGYAQSGLSRRHGEVGGFHLP